MGVSEFEMGSQEGASGKSKDSVAVGKVHDNEDEIKKNRDLDDREEGEIVDDYDFIISSDEELCMRQRIEELEAKNAELEKIAHITDGYVNEYSYSGKHDAQFSSNERYPLASINVLNAMDCQRAAQVPTDASSISSVEFPTPKKRKRRLSKVSKREQRYQQHRGDYNRKHKHSSKRSNMNRTRYHKDLEPIQLDSYESSDGNLSANESSTCYLSREELRFALARSSNIDKNAASLKDRLIKKIVNLNEKNEFETDTSAVQSPELIVVEDDDSDDSVSLEEQELRLIALKSAVMKKHMARKKRDAEVAYSPTDFDDMLNGSAITTQVIDVDIEELENDTRNSMEISPVASPKLHLTPENGENSHMSMASDIIETTDAVNTKPVDMDIANSESEEELQTYYYENKKWMPIEEIPLPDMSGTSIGLSQNLLQQTPYEGIFYPTPIHYTNFYTKTHLEPPPLPPGVFDFDELPPPPPPFHLHSSPSEIFNLNEIKIEKNLCEDTDMRKPGIESINEASSENVLIDKNNRDNHERNDKYLLPTNIQNGEDDDEEEEALRALLLSKFNSPKTFKPKHNISRRVSSPLASDLSQEVEDPEALRSMLLSSIGNRKLCQNPTESILKEAVRRLKMKTYSINSSKKIENKTNIKRKSKSSSPIVIETHFNHANKFEQEIAQSMELSEKDSTAVSNCVQINAKRLDKDNDQTPEGFEKIVEIHNVNKTSHEINHLKKSFEESEESKHIIKDMNDLQIIEKQSDENVAKTFEDNNSENTKEILKSNIEQATKSFKENECTEISNQLQPTVNVVCENSNSQDAEKVGVPADVIETVKLQSISENLNVVCENSNSKVNETLVTPAEVIQNVMQSIPQNVNLLCENSDPQVSEKLRVPSELIQSVESQPKLLIETTARLAKESEQTNSLEMPIASPFNKENMADMCSILHSEMSNISAKITSNKTASTDVPLLNFSELKVPLRSNKIVKPNKVINTQSIIKRKSTEPVPFLSKKPKSSSSPASPIPLSTAVNNYNSSRLVRTADISTIQVKKLIITLRASDSETSEDEMLNCVSNVNKSKNDPQFESNSAIGCTDDNYYDNASPISLPMNSPGDTPKRSNSPSGQTSINNGLKALSECFEKKLDTFLKSVRSKVQHTAAINNMDIAEKTPTAENLKTLSTPLAVRHLPHASQQEYRRLIHRMQLLEKQKQAKKIEKGETLTNVSHQERISLNKILPKASCTNARTVSAVSSSSCDISSKTLVKSVLLKNANINATTLETLNSGQSKKSNMQQASKSNVLRAYESSFIKTGAGIITNLDKSLKLVEEAKQAKITKLRCENRMNELRIEMEELQQKLRMGQLKMSKVYPEICASNDVITTLKQRRVKLFKAATNLGKTIKGNEYRLNNDLKQLISVKSKKLAAEIKLVNSMQQSDIENLIHRDEIEIQNVIALNQDPDKEFSPLKVSITVKDIVPSSSKIETEKTEHENSHSICTAELKEPCAHEIEQNLLIRNESSDSDLTRKETKNCSVQLCAEETENPEHMMEHAIENNEAMPRKVVNGSIEENDGVSLKNQSVREYISPLAHFKTEERQLDPNGIICPYDLMGQCVDNDCKFVHLGVKSSGNE